MPVGTKSIARPKDNLEELLYAVEVLIMKCRQHPAAACGVALARIEELAKRVKYQYDVE